MPHKFDTEKQAAFIAEYEEVKASLTDNDVLLFMDAVHPTQATKVSCGWIPTGVDKMIKTTGSRTRLNIVGAYAFYDSILVSAKIYNLNLSYSLPVEIGPITNLTFYPTFRTVLFWKMVDIE